MAFPQMTPSKIFLCLCFSFILGIALSSFFVISWPVQLSFLILGLILFSLFLINKKLAILGLCLILLAVGIWRHQQAELRIRASALRNFNDREEPITLIGTVVKEPDVRENSIKLTIKTEKIEPTVPRGLKDLAYSENRSRNNSENGSRNIEERVLATVNRYPEYEYGDKLKIKGKLKTPPIFEDFNYQDYLAKQGIFSVVYWPKIELLKKRNYTGATRAIYARVLGFKNKLREVVEQNLSPPQSSILGAIILGDKRKMSQGLKEKLNIAGVRHITAISGMHITILGLIFLEIFLGLGFWRQHALYLSLAFLIVFILMVGAPPSAVRAGIMAGLLIVAHSIGRLSQSARAIVFAGAVILAFNPLLLKSDVGFQLSFLATLGIIYLMPTLQAWLKKVPDNLLGFIGLKSIIAMTLAAQIFTLPILIYNFGRFSLVSLFSNILIVPWLPLLMLIGLLFVLAGVVWPLLGWLFSFPVWFLLTYILAVIGFFSSSAWSAIMFHISWPWLLAAYIILGLLVWHLQRKQRFKFLEY